MALLAIVLYIRMLYCVVLCCLVLFCVVLCCVVYHHRIVVVDLSLD